LGIKVQNLNIQMSWAYQYIAYSGTMPYIFRTLIEFNKFFEG